MMGSNEVRLERSLFSPPIVAPCEFGTPYSDALDEAYREATAVAMAAQMAKAREAYNRRVAIAAYFRAQKRGFAPGHELEDWLAAEAELSGLGSHAGRD